MNLDDAGPGSLRQTLLDAPVGDTIDFAPGLTGTITLTSGELVLDKVLWIAGPGPETLTISGNNTARVLNVTAATSVGISGLTLTDGRSSTQGGGILNAGELFLIDVLVRNCTTLANGTTIRGGGIYNEGVLGIINSTLQNNMATFPMFGVGIGHGGGIFNDGFLYLESSSLSGNVARSGPSAQGTASRGGAVYNSGMVLAISSTLTENTAAGGAGVHNAGTFVAAYATLSNNRGSVSGAGLLNTSSANATIVYSTLSGNSLSGAVGGAGARGAGVYNEGWVAFTHSTISGNTGGTTQPQGAGFYNAASGTTIILSSTLSGNTLTGLGARGGAGYNAGAGESLVITHSTLTRNSAGTGLVSQGGGIQGPATLWNSLVADNTAPASPDTSGVYTSLGHNLIGNGSGGSGFSDTDLVGTPGAPLDPQLEPLANYGGTTLTHRPRRTSPAVDAGDNDNGPDTDQRDFTRIVGPRMDIGAVELQDDEGNDGFTHTPGSRRARELADLRDAAQILLRKALGTHPVWTGTDCPALSAVR